MGCSGPLVVYVFGGVLWMSFVLGWYFIVDWVVGLRRVWWFEKWMFAGCLVGIWWLFDGVVRKMGWVIGF